MTTAFAPLSAVTEVVVPLQATPTAAAPLNWEAAIATLLAELSSVQEELLAVLAEKRERLGSVDVTGMTELQAREQALLERLQACHARREELLAQAKQEGLPADSVQSLATGLKTNASTAERAKLRKELAASQSRMRLLQAQSLTNWVIAQRSLLHVSQMLEIIATGGRLQPTYGVGEAAHARGGMVDHEA